MILKEIYIIFRHTFDIVGQQRGCWRHLTIVTSPQGLALASLLRTYEKKILIHAEPPGNSLVTAYVAYAKNWPCDHVSLMA